MNAVSVPVAGNLFLTARDAGREFRVMPDACVYVFLSSMPAAADGGWRYHPPLDSGDSLFVEDSGAEAVGGPPAEGITEHLYVFRPAGRTDGTAREHTFIFENLQGGGNTGQILRFHVHVERA